MFVVDLCLLLLCVYSCLSVQGSEVWLGLHHLLHQGVNVLSIADHVPPDLERREALAYFMQHSPSGGADPRHGSLGDGQVVGHASRGTCRVRATQGRVLPVVPVTRRQMMAFLCFTTSTQHTRNHIFVFGKKRRQRIRGLV